MWRSVSFLLVLAKEKRNCGKVLFKKEEATERTTGTQKTKRRRCREVTEIKINSFIKYCTSPQGSKVQRSSQPIGRVQLLLPGKKVAVKQSDSSTLKLKEDLFNHLTGLQMRLWLDIHLYVIFSKIKHISAGLDVQDEVHSL